MHFHLTKYKQILFDKLKNYTAAAGDFFEPLPPKCDVQICQKFSSARMTLYTPRRHLLPSLDARNHRLSIKNVLGVV